MWNGYDLWVIAIYMDTDLKSKMMLALLLKKLI